MDRVSQRPSGIVLAGGKARRMGGIDKALITVEGRTIFERTRTVLEPRVDEIIVVTPHPGRYPPGTRTTDDIRPDCGPLGGLHAGLSAARREHAFVVACDMPFLSPPLVDFLLSLAGTAEAVVPEWEGRLQTLHAVYDCRLASAAGEALDRGVRALREFLSGHRVRVVAPGEVAGIEGASRSFKNFNTPDDMDP